jgi:hypothetical protein
MTSAHIVYSFSIMLAGVLRVRFVVALIILAAVARSLSLTWLHPLNWDEIEFFRATDWVRQGLVPYRDFWEHHTPLQWLLFAPVTALVRAPGAAAVIALRWAQVPLWFATFALLSLWMRRAGVDLTARLIAILLALCSSMLMLAAVEYRVDALGCALYILAIVLLQGADRSGWLAFAGGAALCLAGFANIRLGPLLALTALFMRIVRPRERTWGGTRALNGIFAGVLVAFAVCSSYFIATHSAAIAFRRVWTDNYLGDRLSEGTEWILLHRLGVPFGVQLLLRGQPLFDPQLFDLATVVLFVIGTIGVVRTLVANRRSPDHLFALAFLQVGNILFVAAMKFIYIYHFEIVLLLMLPFVAAETDRFLKTRRRWAAVAAGVVLVSGINIFASVFRGKEGDLAYQDLVMREVHRQTPPDSKVFDGVGWALRRKPAYRYWFLPMLVSSLEAKGIFEPYTPQQMSADPPAAVITDNRAYGWLLTHPQLAGLATSHYLPRWRNLWLAGLSARLTPSNPSAEWIVPVSGAYRIYASDVLAIHPWFQNPMIFGTFESRRTEIALTGFPPADRLPLQWEIDGAPVPARDILVLQRRQRLRVAARIDRPLGMMIVPVETRGLFLQPPPGITLDGATIPVTHVPSFPSIFR